MAVEVWTGFEVEMEEGEMEFEVEVKEGDKCLLALGRQFWISSSGALRLVAHEGCKVLLGRSFQDLMVHCRQ